MASTSHFAAGTGLDWLGRSRQTASSPPTARTYGSAIRADAAAIGDLGAATRTTVSLWAYAPGPSGRTPAPSTVSVRLAALRGLHRYAGRVGVWYRPNLTDDVDRPRAAQPIPKGLDAAIVPSEVSWIISTRPAEWVSAARMGFHAQICVEGADCEHD